MGVEVTVAAVEYARRSCVQQCMHKVYVATIYS